MTKEWEDVREEICSLYHEGMPLSQVRKKLKDEHNFNAS